jgi:hypothetical protein
MGHWLEYYFGLTNLSGPWYGFWSGVGSDIAELAIIGGLITLVHKHNCHAKGCWRIGKHKVEGTEYVTCRKHHPEDTPTAEHIHARWQAAKLAKHVESSGPQPRNRV